MGYAISIWVPANRSSGCSTSCAAHEMSAICPSVTISRNGRPFESIAKCSLVLSPPRERPSACGPLFLKPRPNAGARVRSSNRSGRARFPSGLPVHSQPAAIRHCFASARSGYTPYAIGRTLQASRAMGYPSGQSTAPLRETSDCWMPFGRGRLPCPAGCTGPCSILHRSVTFVPSRLAVPKDKM